MKELYTFKIKDGETEKTVFLKQLSAKDKSLLGIVYSAELSKAMKRGVMSRNDMRRIVLDDGGGKHAKIDKESRGKLIKELETAERKFHQLSLEKKDLRKITKKIMEIRAQVEEMDRELVHIFGNCAEVIASQITVVWAVANFTFWEDKSNVFAGEDDEERLNAYYAAIDEETVEQKIGEKALCFFQAALIEGYTSKEQFQKLEENIDELTQAEKVIS